MLTIWVIITMFFQQYAVTVCGVDLTTNHIRRLNNYLPYLAPFSPPTLAQKFFK